MHVISRKMLKLAIQRHPEAKPALEHWYRVVRTAHWRRIEDVRKAFPHADAAIVASGKVATIFNIAGNKYRLIAALHYNRSKVYVIMVLTHAEYSKDSWKDRL